MAEKKIHMGDDPLAWLAEDDSAAKKAEPSPKRTRTRRTSRKKTAPVKTEIELVKESFAILVTQGEELVSRFYEQLFEQNPKLAPLFDNVSVVGQQKKLLASLVLLVHNLDKPGVLKDYLLGLGARHVHYGVSQQQYQLFTDSLISVMSEMMGKKWTSQINDAWQNTLNNVTTIMLGTYKPVGADEMATNKQADNQELMIMRAAVDGATTALMMCDANRVITYANPAVMSLLQNRLTELRKVFPGLNLKKLIGTCIDDFHKDPSLQKGILSDVDNLPYQAQIQLLDIHFDLNATAIVDVDGNYMGNMVEWKDITDQVNAQAEADIQAVEVSRLQSAIDSATTALMMCDENRVITFANPAVMALLENRLPELKKVFPKIDLSKLIGTNIDGFHNDPSHQAKILADVDNLPYRSQIQLLDLHFDLNASAIIDADGNYMGNLVEWQDITDQVNAENAIQSLITAAEAGQLEERIDASDYSGFMKTIAKGINSVMDTVLAPVQEIIRVSQALSKGDLTQNMDGEYQGIFAILADALNDSVNKMSETVQEINDTATSIGTAASEISEGNIDLSQRTEQQASSLEETASSMEELTSTVRQNSDNARQANQLAESSREQAEKGGSVIKEAIEAMSAISTSSKKVTDIIGVIDEIAFQTNLLALNAAVEAARAGEQGRGFAVVASEVRKLAQRSASAAKEIKELINDSGEKVKEGSMLVDESGRTLEEIVASSKKVGDIISEIAAAGAEQTQGIEQVTTAVGQMDEMTQQNAALVEQAAAASESLDDQGKSLQRLMSFFSVDEQSDEPAPQKAKAKPAVKKAKPKPKSTPVADDDDEWDEF